MGRVLGREQITGQWRDYHNHPAMILRLAYQNGLYTFQNAAMSLVMFLTIVLAYKPENAWKEMEG